MNNRKQYMQDYYQKNKEKINGARKDRIKNLSEQDKAEHRRKSMLRAIRYREREREKRILERGREIDFVKRTSTN